MKRLNKVAPITFLFWLMKVVATTLGETLGDFISMTLNYGYVIGLGITSIILIIVLLIQLNAKEYSPVKYWLVIIGTTTLGTEISDFIDRSLHTGYLIGSILLASCLATSLLVWYKKYKNLEVYPIIEKNKEILFWKTILFSNSLGTAFGDFLSDNLGLSYLHGASNRYYYFAGSASTLFYQTQPYPIILDCLHFHKTIRRNFRRFSY